MNELEELYNWQERYGFTQPEGKVKIYYDPTVFAQIVQLVKAYSVEIGWDMIILPHKDGYKVYDILVYPQMITSAHIYVDRSKYGMWKATIDTKTEAAMNGQGHSHVRMQTFKSITDERQQHDEILTKTKGGFFLFQIWNKMNDINSFFYDLDNHFYYTNESIELIVEDVDYLVKESFAMVSGVSCEVGEDFESE